MINESTLGETLAQLETTSSRARTAFERVRSANHDCSRLEGDPDVQRRVSRREQWEREVANFLSGYSGLPNLDEADLRSEALIAVAADIGLDYGITPIDARQNRSPEYRRHVKNLPPHLGKQLAAVFAPLEPLDRRDRERERYRLLDAEQAALWEQVRLELEAVPPLADVYTQELESHTRDARRFARKIRLTSVAEDVRRLLDAFNSIGGPA
jgi:hypothetical protein